MKWFAIIEEDLGDSYKIYIQNYDISDPTGRNDVGFSRAKERARDRYQAQVGTSHVMPKSDLTFQ